ncbi:MAG TPA: lysine--tRNA ligase, partial [Pyrinomonadaceae bacterium]|nr:lysine--tRNA ligase [Pyrinomonadaceae bacterium]
MAERLPEEIVPDNDQTRARREHLEKIQALVGNPYPNKFARTSLAPGSEGEDTITSIAAAFRVHEPEVEEGGRPSAEQLEAANEALKSYTVRVSGRIATPPRVMGKAAFVHLSDGRERLQIYVRKQDAAAVSNDSLQPVEEGESGWKLFQLLDHGDFIGVEGFLFVTKTGELSVHVEKIQFLSKSLLPMPDKMHGIADPEIRQRQRYADLIASSLKVEREPGELTTREVFERRSRLITHLRRYLDDHGYVEVETPMLSPIASGAAARPFKTHHNALDIELYLRIAPELYLKRLLVGGFERVYELNRNFRNEGIGYRWNPEFTMLEFYTAYQDAEWMMDFCEEMLRATILASTGTTRVTFNDEEIDFGQQFKRLTMKQAIDEYFPQDYTSLGSEPYDKTWLDDPTRLHLLNTFLGARKNNTLSNESAWLIAESQIRHFENHKVPQDDTLMARETAEIFEHVAEHRLLQPTFITDFPKSISPLSKGSPNNPAVAERFELYVAGMEIANGFSELNDPAEQLERFGEQARQRERGDDEAMQTDEDYVRALSYGMPPAAGIGIGIDRLTMLL